MKVLLTKILFVLVVMCFTVNNQRDMHILLDRATKNDKDVFISDYLSEAFTKWSNHVRINRFHIDSVFIEDVYEEVWLSRKIDDPYRIALTISSAEKRKIIDIRRLFFTDYKLYKSYEIEILKFLERFLWIYELSDESFMHDFLYTVNIKMRYKGLASSTEVFHKMRHIYGNLLPLRSVSWEDKYPFFLITAEFDSSLTKLEIELDLNKYLTNHYFEISDKYTLVSNLQDSLKVWQNPKKIVKQYPNLIISSTSAQTAIRESLQKLFRGYNFEISDSADTSAIVKASLPQIYGLTPFILKFQLQARENESDQYEMNAIWQIDWEDLTKQILSNSLDTIKNTNKRDIIKFSNLIQSAALRYSTLSLPASLLPEYAEKDSVKGQLILHFIKTDTIRWRGVRAFNNILRGLAKGNTTRYFPNNIAFTESYAIFGSFAIIKNEQFLYHHVVKLEEIYTNHKNDRHLDQITAHLYPYIRTDNLRNLFSESDTSKYELNSIKIRW